METHTAFLFFAALVSTAVAGEDGSDADSIKYNYGTPEAKEIGTKLGEYLANIYVGLEEYLQGLSETCSAAVSLEEYNSALSLGDNSGCHATTPEGYENAKTRIAEAAANCREADTVEDLALFITEVEKAQTRVEHLDKLLSKNNALCSSHKLGTNACEQNKERIEGQLKNILSNKETARFQHLLRNAYFNTKEIVDTCMDSATKDLKSELDSAIKTIKDCLGY